MEPEAHAGGKVVAARCHAGRLGSWRWDVAGLVGLCLLAGFIRFTYLGRMDTRADEVELLEFMQRGTTLGEYFQFHVQTFKVGRQMPLPRMATCALIRTTGLEPSLFSIRLPFAVLGILVVPALWLLGWHAGGRKMAWALGFLGLVNPYIIYWARVAHVYAFVMCFFTAAAAFFVALIRSLATEGAKARRTDFFLFSIFSILACYSHMSAWPAAGVLWIGLIVFGLRGRRCRGRDTVSLWASFTLWVLAILPWALAFVSAVFTEKESFPTTHQDVVGQLRSLAQMPMVMGWGGRWPRLLASVGLPLGALVAAALSARRHRTTVWAVGYGLVVFAILGFMQYAASGTFEAIRYYIPLWTLMMLLSGLGLLAVAEWIARAVRVSQTAVLTGLCVLMTVLCWRPVLWTVMLPGNPMPYSMMNRWMDAHLPKGAPVLVDRWFEPMHEMRAHAPSNVYVTFTIPDEPLEVFLKYRWRDTAIDFFKKYPDAAYLELVRHYFEIPEVGWWAWPREHFKRHITFTNEQALALGRLSLMPDPSIALPGALTRRIVVDLFYNLPEDVVEAARAEGKQHVVLYAPGWGYVKTQDYRDWRVLSDRAALHVYNLADQPTSVSLEIQAAAVGNVKQVRFRDQVYSFPANNLGTARLGPFSCEPGLNVVELADPLWSARKTQLLVGGIRVIKE